LNLLFLGEPLNNSTSLGCYDAEVHLRTNAIGMPIGFNGSILSSDKKSLELIADSKYPTNFFTRNQIEYDINEWSVVKLQMSGTLIIICICIPIELLCLNFQKCTYENTSKYTVMKFIL